MNAKLKSTLNNAWNEPRHFFFWLALLSLCGFVALQAGTFLLTYETQKGGVGLLLGFLQLGGLIGFVFGTVAFILAWIPPLRRLFAWLLGRRFLALACLATLIGLFYAIENWRGRHAWQQFKREREAQGERFELTAFIPPPVPADQNFFDTPLWADLHFSATNGSVVWEGPMDQGRNIFDVYGTNATKVPHAGNWLKAQHTDLMAWQGYYRGASNTVAEAVAPGAPASREAEAIRRRYGLEGTPDNASASPPTNYFPVAKEPQAPAADVLLALSRFAGNRELLIAAAARPEARFWANYDAGYAVLLPHLARVKGTAQFLSLHATASLKAGDRAAALEDVTLALRLLDAIRHEPALISHLVRVAALQIALQPVWEGLADRQWTAADLSVIEGKLAKLDFLADYEAAMRGERACNLWGVDYIRRVGLDGVNDIVTPGASSGQPAYAYCLGRAFFRLIPRGWFDWNKLALARNHERLTLPLVDLERRVALPAMAQQSEAALEAQPRSLYDIFSRLLMPALSGCVNKFARAQTSVDLARVACALERFRMDNGQFPETLQALAPKYIAKLPHDIINGQPLQYRRTDDGQFVLYSVGWNGTDDRGQFGLNESGNLDIKTGDWVWRYPAK